jgi:hypothetical protein
VRAKPVSKPCRELGCPARHARAHGDRGRRVHGSFLAMESRENGWQEYLKYCGPHRAWLLKVPRFAHLAAKNRAIEEACLAFIKNLPRALKNPYRGED